MALDLWLARLTAPPYSAAVVWAQSPDEVIQLAWEACQLDGHPCGCGEGGVCPWSPFAPSEGRKVWLRSLHTLARPGVILANWDGTG